MIRKARCSFLKKRTKKLLIFMGITRAKGINDTSVANFKSFLLLFFKKEDFFPLLGVLPSSAVTNEVLKHDFLA
jgi:hypothetical protein